MMDPASAAHSSGKLKQAKADLDSVEREFRDVDMLYNIMIINMAHVEIDKYKLERQVKYAHMLSEHSQQKVVACNDMHGFFRFLRNFYDISR